MACPPISQHSCRSANGTTLCRRLYTRNPSDRTTVRLEIAGEEKYSQLAMPRTVTLDRTLRASVDGVRRAIGWMTRRQAFTY